MAAQGSPVSPIVSEITVKDNPFAALAGSWPTILARFGLNKDSDEAKVIAEEALHDEGASQSALLLLACLINDNTATHAKVDALSAKLEDVLALLRSQGQLLIAIQNRTQPQKSVSNPSPPNTYTNAAAGTNPTNKKSPTSPLKMKLGHPVVLFGDP